MLNGQQYAEFRNEAVLNLNPDAALPFPNPE